MYLIYRIDFKFDMEPTGRWNNWYLTDNGAESQSRVENSNKSR